MKKIKQLGIVLITYIFSIIMITGTAYAADKGTITSETVRMRSEPSKDSSIVMLVSIDSEVEILEEQDEWYKVKYDGATGYISKGLVKVEGQEEAKTEEQPKEENTVKEETTKTEEPKVEEETKTEEIETTSDATEITVGYTGKTSTELKLKLVARVNSVEIDTIKKDTQITVTQVLNDWCYIETEGESGWVRTANLTKAVQTQQPAEENKEETKPEEETKTEEKVEEKVGYVNVDSVNVRKETNTSSDILTSLEKNDKVTILGEESNWYKVKVDGITGYIAKKYISDKKTETTSRASDTARKIEEKNGATEETKTTQTTQKPTAASKNGSDVVAYARSFLGKKYVSGGSSPSTGFDCSGFTCYVYKKFGVSLSRSSVGQNSNGKTVAKSSMQPGDLVIFQNSAKTKVGHVGIYVGGNQFIHAANEKKGVIITSMSNSYYAQRFVAAKRVL